MRPRSVGLLGLIALSLCPILGYAQTTLGATQGGTGSNAVPGKGKIPISDGAKYVPGNESVSPPTSGLMARYDIPATDSAAALTDSSGNGRNGTGTEGTAPTITAITGGLACSGAGSSKLPAALNTALSVAVYLHLDPPMTTGAYYAPFFGNGNLAASNAIGMFISNAFNFEQASSSNRILTYNGTFASQAEQGFFGTGSLMLTLGATDHTFTNGIENSYAATPGASAGTQTAGFYQLCGNATGSGAGAVTRMPSGSTIYNAYFYDHVLSATEIAQLNQWFTISNTARGVPPSLTSTATGSQVTIVGDSLMQLATYTPLGEYVTLTGTPTIYNRSANSGTMQEATINQPYMADIHFIPGGKNNIAFIWLGTNDCIAGRTGAQIVQDMANFSRARRVLGWKTVVSTMVSRNAGDTCKNTLNGLIRSGWNQWADSLADIAADVNLGADADYTNSSFFNADGIHPLQNSVNNDEVPIVQRAINRILGNRDFSSATTYTTTALATVATTAGSESGQTATITFGATPANCVIGSTIVIAGTTPAGYSNATGWVILTRSATQVTFLTTSSALGAITSQGTGVCPQQVDGDVYINLAGSTGGLIFTLESAVGYTGQNIYIRNLNSGNFAWTITPFAAETINGASSYALGAGQVVCLQSALVSAAAGGDNWVGCGTAGPVNSVTAPVTLSAAGVLALAAIPLATGVSGTLQKANNPQGIHNFNQAAQSQVVVSATEYYVTNSDLDMPAAYTNAIGAGTVMKWRIALNKTAAGTGTFQILVKKGTNGSTADTSIVTQTIGTQTAAADNMEADVVLTWTSATAAYWTIIPRQSAATGIGFGLVYPAVAAQFNGTISGQTTTTASDKYGLSVKFTTGTPTFIVTMVQAEALGVN